MDDKPKKVKKDKKDKKNKKEKKHKKDKKSKKEMVSDDEVQDLSFWTHFISNNNLLL